MRILYVHKKTQHALGDSIREEAILSFLRKDPKQFKIVEADLRLPNMNVKDLLGQILFSTPSSTFFKAYKARSDLKFAAILNVFSNRLKETLRKDRYDIILSETTPLAWLTLKSMDKLNISVPHVVDVHGLWYAEDREAGRGTWLEAKLIEMETLRRASRVFAISAYMKEVIENELGVKKEKIIIIPNGAPSIRNVSKYRLPMKVVYAGIFDHYENLEMFQELAKLSIDEQTKFFMFGTGALIKRILYNLEKEAVPIKYLGYVPTSQMRRLLPLFNIGVIFSSNDTARKVAFPIKILDYAACGLPVVAPRIGDWGKLIEKEKIGFSVKNNPADYKDAINRLAESTTWNRTSQNAIAFAKRRQWDHVLKPIYNCLQEIRVEDPQH